MLRNLFRQSFWAVFVPLLLVAGLFWMDELRGYRVEVSLLVLPKMEIAAGAAGNLAALARETSFALAVYDADDQVENPLIGKTPAERKAIWKKTARIGLVGESDVIHISVLGSDQDEALGLTKSVVTELVRTGSRYYNQKTDVDIRVVEEPVMIPSLTAWPRFLAFIIGTALFFTTLFFLVYSLIERLFPKRHTVPAGNGEYVISSDTFKPRVPTYWGREDHAYPAEVPATVSTAPEEARDDEYATDEPMARALEGYAAPARTESISEIETETDPVEPIETIALTEEPTDLTESYVEEVTVPEVIEDTVNEESYEEPAAETEPTETTTYAGYALHAAAPDNLPIVDEPINPLQGAQSRLMKADIDAAAEARAFAAEAALPEEPSKPQTHEPTPDEYRRRLNELLSGKM
ncbi:MAG: hypothetical protein WAT81_02245 [Candidatus Moraniibacteriota bacterium]